MADTDKTRTMYDRGPAGRSRQVAADQVDAWKKAGWFLTPAPEAEGDTAPAKSETKKS